MEKKKESLLASVKKDKPEVVSSDKASEGKIFLSKMVKRMGLEIGKNNIINRGNTLNKGTEIRKL